MVTDFVKCNAKMKRFKTFYISMSGPYLMVQVWGYDCIGIYA